MPPFQPVLEWRCPLVLTNKLTDTAIRNAKHGEKSVKLSDGGGLYLELHPNGSRYWRMKYRYLAQVCHLAVQSSMKSIA